MPKIREERIEFLRHLFLKCLPSEADAFARSRFDEGERTVGLLNSKFPELFSRGKPRVLELGSGNGGMLFPFALGAHAVALDTYIDADLRRFAALSGLSIGHVRATASALPFRSNSLDVVLMAEVIEHLPQPRKAAREVMRVLRSGGVCLISTPPRLKFLTRRDPHFGIPSLVALPDPLQRLIAARIANKRHAYVHHIYATTWGIRRLFPSGSATMHVISHRRDWTRHLSWNYVAFQKTCKQPSLAGQP
jgi:SAM-dependent methyltransferase